MDCVWMLYFFFKAQTLGREEHPSEEDQPLYFTALLLLEGFFSPWNRKQARRREFQGTEAAKESSVFLFCALHLELS